jgi:hypothetical protein
MGRKQSDEAHHEGRMDVDRPITEFPTSPGPESSAQPVISIASSNPSPLLRTGQDQVPLLSDSLSRWVAKVQKAKQSLSRGRSSSDAIEPLGPSPVASRTRTSLKRASSFSGEEDLSFRTSGHDRDRTSLSLRKAMAKRITSEAPKSKRVKRDMEE